MNFWLLSKPGALPYLGLTDSKLTAKAVSSSHNPTIQVCCVPLLVAEICNPILLNTLHLGCVAKLMHLVGLCDKGVSCAPSLLQMPSGLPLIHPTSSTSSLDQ